MFESRYLLGSAVALLAGFSSGCGPKVTTQELASARDAYAQAMRSDAVTLNPTGLYEAKQSLTQAEKAHADDPGSLEERDYGYVAERRVRLAVAKANALAAERNVAAADTKYKQELEANANNLKEKSENYAGQLKDAKGEIAAAEAKRAEAEKREAEARQALERLAAVKEEQNRVVVTLSGSVLFKSASAELLPIAQDRLNSVAEALKSYEGAAITIEGHTDSRGSDDANLKLSQARAESVRSYLVSQGLPDTQIKAVGKGESTPVADNATPEGQATNRRVEIVIDRRTAEGGAPNSNRAVSSQSN